MTRLILCLGMHRSGTSAIAGALPALGVSLGDRSNWSGPDNPNFHEDLDVLALDEAVLQACWSKWDNLTAPSLQFKSTPMITGHQLGIELNDRAEAVLRKRLDRYPVFGLKEPRLCRLLPFWVPIFEATGCEVSVIYVVRHPSAVAASLKKRNGLSTTRGLYLWLSHVIASFVNAPPSWKKVVVGYDEFIERPWGPFMRIAEELSLDMLDDVTIPVDPTLRHQREGGDLPPIIDRTWQLVKTMAREGASYPGIRLAMTEIAAQMTYLEPLFREIDATHTPQNAPAAFAPKYF